MAGGRGAREGARKRTRKTRTGETPPRDLTELEAKWLGSQLAMRSGSATVTNGVGRPAEASRSWATEPSGRKWSAGGMAEIIIGASVWPKSCAITGPIFVSASSSREAEMGAAPYQKHCSESRLVCASCGCSSSM